MKYLESSESTYIKSQNDLPSPKIPHERVAQILRFLREFVNLRVAQPVVKYTFGYFNGTAWTPRLRSPTPIMDPVTSDEGQNILADIPIMV